MSLFSWGSKAPIINWGGHGYLVLAMSQSILSQV